MSELNINVTAGQTLELSPKSEVYEVVSFSMVGTEGNLATIKSSIPGVKIYLDMKEFPSNSLEYCSFKDIVLYGGKINVLHGVDLGGNVDIYFSPKTVFDCFLNKQVETISTLILSMKQEDGYNFNWQTTQNRNLAIGGFPRAEIYVIRENNLDEDENAGLGSHSYTNEVDYEIRIRTKFTSPSNNVMFDYFKEEHLMIDDLKRLFGKEVNLTLLGSCDKFLYKGFEREIEAKDEYTPKGLATKWRAVYNQDRNYPDMYAGS